jgi:hypothetical protein
MSKIVQLIQITKGCYNEEEIGTLEEILANNYKGEIKIEHEDAYENEAGILVAFTYPYNRQNQRGRDGQTYIWVNKNDIEGTENTN